VPGSTAELPGLHFDLEVVSAERWLRVVAHEVPPSTVKQIFYVFLYR